MSGPVEATDADREVEDLPGIEAREGRHAEVGGLPIRRVLPTKGRRTVGAWCFVDLAGPADAEEPDPMEVGPHPHIGLHTVTWLLEGEALHTDSLGTEQVIRPGQLNLMSAGHGIAHAELAAEPPFRAVQLWVAQPDATRHGANGFEHHAELPTADLGKAHADVLVGTLGEASSAARADTPLVGAQLTAHTSGTASLPLSASYEHAVVPLDGRVRVADEIVEPGWIALVPPGRDELPVQAASAGERYLLLGGEPFEAPVAMWWNFVARDRDELTAAWQAWRDRDEDRFGDVPSTLDRIEAPTPPWIGQR